VTSPKIVVHTDVFLDFVLHRTSEASILRRAMRTFFCYTTVFNAIELFSIAKTERERNAVEHAMSAMKILGLNPKNAKRYGDLLASGARLPRMNVLIAGVCLESKLPVLTGQPKEFHGVKELVVIPTSSFLHERSALDIVKEYTLRSRRNYHP
jgi:predicted nucleic acid-binding protein